MDTSQENILKQILCHRNEIIRCVFAGYQMFEEHIIIAPYTNLKQTRRSTRGAAVEQQFKEACCLDRLPFICEKKLNASRGAEHVELSNNELVITISSVKSSTKPPRRAVFREQLTRLQGDLFEPNNLDTSILLPQKRYFIITHGGNGSQPEFVCLGVPHPEGGWKYVMNLMSQPYQILSQEPEEKADIQEPVLKLKDKYSNNHQDRNHGEETR
jgi:hypothetical protein